MMARRSPSPVRFLASRPRLLGLLPDAGIAVAESLLQRGDAARIAPAAQRALRCDAPGHPESVTRLVMRQILALVALGRGRAALRAYDPIVVGQGAALPTSGSVPT